MTTENRLQGIRQRLAEYDAEEKAYDEYWHSITGPVHWRVEHYPRKDQRKAATKALNDLAPDDLRTLLAVAEAAVAIAENRDEYFNMTPNWGGEDGHTLCLGCGANWQFQDDKEQTEHGVSCPVNALLEAVKALEAE